MHRLHVRISLIAAVLSATACASAIGGRSPSVFRTSAATAPGQSCTGGRWTAELPPLARLLDSAAVVSAAGRLPNGYGVWEVRWDSTGAPDSTRVVETDLGGALLSDAEAAVRTAMRPVEPDVDAVDVEGEGRRERPRERVYLLRVDAGDSASLRLADAEECLPVLANRAAIQFRLMEEFEQAMAGTGQVQRTLVLEMMARTDGSATDLEVVRSSGIARVDQLALDLGRSMRFAPARLNRRPVDVLVSIPFTLVVGRTRGGSG